MIDRREAFRVLTAAAVAGPIAGQVTAQVTAEVTAHVKPGKPRFFSEDEYKLVQQLCAIIIPADDEGGGALEAGVPWYIDTIVLHAEPSVQATWKHGVQQIEATGFTGLTEAGKTSTLEKIAANELAPVADVDRFFVRLKTTIIDGFCASRTGIDYLGYKGNAGSLTFPGCTHPEHQKYT